MAINVHLAEIQLKIDVSNSPFVTEVAEYFFVDSDGDIFPTGNTATLTDKPWSRDSDGDYYPNGNTDNSSLYWEYDGDGDCEIQTQ